MINRNGNVCVWESNGFKVTWEPNNQRYVVTKGYNKIRVVYRWKDTEPYLT